MPVRRSLAVLGLSLVVTLAAQAGDAPRPSGLDPRAFDATVRPQDDLFRHVNGRWLASYVPAQLRAYPFSLQPIKGKSNEFTLMLDEDAQQLKAGEEKLFDGGKLHPAAQRHVNILEQMQKAKLPTARAIAAVREAGLETLM